VCDTDLNIAILFFEKARESMKRAKMLKSSTNCIGFLKESKNSFILIARTLLALRNIDVQGIWNPQDLSSIVEKIEPRAKGIHERSVAADMAENAYQDLCKAANLYLELSEKLLQTIKSIKSHLTINNNVPIGYNLREK